MSYGDEGFREYLRVHEREIADAGRGKAIIGHDLTRGEAREVVLRRELRTLLPKRYEVRRGEVRANDGSCSTQWDVLIYDALDTPLLHHSEENVVVPVEGVLAAISVKSTVNKAAIEDVADAAGRLREMPRKTLGLQQVTPLAQPAVLLIGFDGVKLSTARTHVLKATEGPTSPKVLHGVCVIRSGLVVPCNEEGNVAPERIATYRVAHATRGAFGIFLGVLWAVLRWQPPVTPDLLAHIGMGELLDEEFR